MSARSRVLMFWSGEMSARALALRLLRREFSRSPRVLMFWSRESRKRWRERVFGRVNRANGERKLPRDDRNVSNRERSERDRERIERDGERIE
ncbi:MAG TPA: hypothetical protein VNM90_03710 [Haliangium sp.]|nr:hypothetical protein [Haliangium sp.]